MKIKNWTNEQINYLLENYYDFTVNEIAKKIGKKPDAVSRIAKKFGLSKQKHKSWSDDENEYLITHYYSETAEEIAKHLKRGIISIRAQASHLGLSKEANWSKEEEQYLIDNYQDNNYSAISEKLGRTEGAIRAKCFDLNLVKNDRWSDEDIQYIKDNYYRMPTKDIATTLDRTPSAIQIKAKKLGLKKYPYSCNYRFFENIDTEEKAYWLGFLSADGWINKNEETGSGVVGVELQYGDIQHLKKFNKSLEGNYQITDRWRPCNLSNPNKKNHHCVLRIFSIDMYNDLTKYGFSRDKSYIFKFPSGIPDDLIRHYMRGYFDGDGCFGFTRSKNTGALRDFSCSYISASKDIIMDFERILHKIGIYSARVDERKCDGFATTWRIHINQGNDYNKYKFLNYLYHDANIYLDRKYKRYLEVIEQFNKRLPHQTEMSGSFIL